MKIKAQIAMVMNLDKCIGCHTCGVTCKNTWTNRPGSEYMWFNNVETKPGVGYPILWEDQEKHKGGWVREMVPGKLRLKAGNSLFKLANIFHNPDMPSIDEYYEPWTYEYEKLTRSGKKRHQPTARPKSLLTGETMSLKWGPNWEDDLAGGHVTGPQDLNLNSVGNSVKFELEHAFMMYLPRICEHCLNPSCVASCPSGAIYKRDEDGIVLVDQEQCRGWRYCMSGCPYKKVYFNWETSKAEKCTFCFPRIEAGLPSVCSETCTGRMRYIGVLLYDSERVYEAANTYDSRDIYRDHLSLFLDPNDPQIIAQAKLDGLSMDWIEAAQNSPIYKMAIQYKIALPLHPEYRTLPMVWYIPPLSPFTSLTEGKDRETKLEDMFPEIMQMRIPIRYLANLLTGGDNAIIESVLKKMVVMRQYMRNKTLGKETSEQVLQSVGMNAESVEEMYRLLAIAKYKDRFVIPTSSNELLNTNAYEMQGSTGYSFDCNTCKEGEYNGTNDNFHNLNT